MDEIPSHPAAPPTEVVVRSVQTLAYENPIERMKRDPPPSVLLVLLNTCLGLLGFVFSAAGIAIAGAIVFGAYQSGPSSKFAESMAATAFLLGIAALAWLVYVFRNPAVRSIHGRWYTYGALLGSGLMLLLGGACFLRQLPG